MKHTPGPLRLLGDQLCVPYTFNQPGYDATLTVHQAVAEVITTREDARLLGAAYNSYDEHCGEHAVECAENDLLGKLLETCRHDVVELANLASMVDPEQTREYMSTVYAAIAMTRGKDDRIQERLDRHLGG